VLELMSYFAPAQPGQRVTAVPGVGLDVPVWIWAQASYGAQLAAVLGLPYAFASHFAPGALEQALHVYRPRLPPVSAPGPALRRSRLQCIRRGHRRRRRAPDDLDQQAFVNLRTGTPGRCRRRRRLHGRAPGRAQAMLRSALSCTAAGGPDTVRRAVDSFIARTGVDEIILTSQTFDHAARLRSFEIAADILGQGRAAEAA
jgi:alkanesulfonate monooxygenase SsuD/methylene tetrahydromethanopterin reductase-like flavin-dependent oxidoreductase (luciferase family)